MKRLIQQLNNVLSNNPVYLASPYLKLNHKTSQVTTYAFINFYQIVLTLERKRRLLHKGGKAVMLYGSGIRQ